MWGDMGRYDLEDAHVLPLRVVAARRVGAARALEDRGAGRSGDAIHPRALGVAALEGGEGGRRDDAAARDRLGAPFLVVAVPADQLGKYVAVQYRDDLFAEVYV